MVDPDPDTIPKEAWFTETEYRRRIAAVRAVMERRGLEGLVVVSPANIFYLTGHHSIDTWEFRAAVLGLTGDPSLLVYSFERGRFLASSWLHEASYYRSTDDPLERLAALIEEAGMRDRRLGVEQGSGWFTPETLRRVAARLPSSRIEGVERLVEQVRVRKSDEELACIRRAALLTAAGMRAAIDAVREGAVDYEIAAAAASSMLREGSHQFVMMPTVAVGYRSGLAHSPHDGVRVRRGDSVFVELSGCYRHYSAPLMHTAVVGQPAAEWVELLDASRRTADVITRAARPGVPACEVARAALGALRGLDAHVEFHYNFGYSIGISFPPHWLEDSQFHIKSSNPGLLEPGMVFHVPLVLRVLGKFAAGTSRTIAINQQGAEVLTGG